MQKIREYKEAGNDEIHVICYFLLFVFTGVLSKKLIALVMAAAVCLCLAAVAGSEQINALAGENGIAMEYETALFDTDEAMQVNILMDEDEWKEGPSTSDKGTQEHFRGNGSGRFYGY